MRRRRATSIVWEAQEALTNSQARRSANGFDRNARLALSHTLDCALGGTEGNTRRPQPGADEMSWRKSTSAPRAQGGPLCLDPKGAAGDATCPKCYCSEPAGYGSAARCAGHQFQRPRSETVDGIRSVRTRKVSMRMPAEMANPIC